MECNVMLCMYVYIYIYIHICGHRKIAMPID